MDIGWEDKCDMIYIDGQPASEYVRKYSPDHAGNKNYVKAQIAAAVTSGRHHVDVVTLRTRNDGTFQAEATELTADLSALNELQRWGESTRESPGICHDPLSGTLQENQYRERRAAGLGDRYAGEKPRAGAC